MLRVFEAFSGYGSQSLALKRLNIEHEVVCISEIDKYAIQGYTALHGEVLNLGDISKINTEDIPEHDLFTYSFPCQDISVAGLQKGLVEGQTRSGLLWECERIIEAKRPKYLLMENVKNLVSKKFTPDFLKWKNKLEQLGYTNYTQVLNAKDYGIPQNRERVFMISILGEHKPYEFPQGFDNGLRLKDFLEDEVDEKYYINNEKAKKLIAQLPNKKETFCCDGTIDNPKEKEISNCIKARYDNGISNQRSTGTMVAIPCLTPDRLEKRQNGRRFKEDGEPMFTLTGQDRHGIVQVGNYREKETGFTNPQTGRVYSADGVSPTLNTMQGGDRSPKILEKNFILGGEQAHQAVKTDGICTTLTSSMGTGGGYVPLHNYNYRIRKLTPRECFRLMGLYDSDIDKIQAAGISNSQQYKLAGNSIVVDVLMYIFKNLFANEVEQKEEIPEVINDTEVLNAAIAHYGTLNQKIIAIEEMGELTKEITKELRGMGDTKHIAEEIADVEIMIEQLKLIYNAHESVNAFKKMKVERLSQRMKQAEN